MRTADMLDMNILSTQICFECYLIGCIFVCYPQGEVVEFIDEFLDYQHHPWKKNTQTHTHSNTQASIYLLNIVITKKKNPSSFDFTFPGGRGE